MKVGAFASVAGVSTKVLRDYDAREIFRPAWTDPVSRYRMYSPAQLPQLRRILALRDVGVGLDALRNLIVDGHDLTEVLHQRRDELQRAQRELNRQLRVLGVQLGGEQPDVVVRVLPAMRVAVLTLQPADDVSRAFYTLERKVQRAQARAPLPPGLVERSGATSAYIYVPVRRGTHRGLEVESLPSVRAATILHEGDYAGLERSRRRLRRWLSTAGLVPTGPRRVVYLRFGAEPELRLRHHYLVDDAEELLTELQWPIETLDGPARRGRALVSSPT